MNASDYQLGTGITQNSKLIMCYSTKLIDTQHNCTTTDKIIAIINKAYII